MSGHTSTTGRGPRGDRAALRGFAPARPQSELAGAVGACRSYFVTAAAFSFAINLLYLAPPLYMLQVYDRVIPSASVLTLVMLSLVLLLAFATLGALDAIRGVLLTRASMRLDRLLGARVVAGSIEAALPRGNLEGLNPLRDFDLLRQTLTGAGVQAAFDLPWVPVYVLIIALLHPVLGLFALLSAIALVGLAIVNERQVGRALSEANEAAGWSYHLAEMAIRNAEVVAAMGLGPGFLGRWSKARNLALARQQSASERAAVMMAAIKVVRLAMQSGVLGVGALLAIENLTSVGAVFAASILLGRALQPVEQVVGAWKGILSGRAAWHRLAALMDATRVDARPLALPRPAGHLSVEGLGFAPAPGGRAVLHDVSFDLAAGEICCIIGPSGAGKSTLVRHLVAVVPPTVGKVRLDGADLTRLPRDTLGRHVGYLPQDIELFADTVAANIGRFTEQQDERIVEAARIAGVHDLILHLPEGYETTIGEGGALLSGGTRQRIALARAVFAGPSLVVLDEPSSNLDAEGDMALAKCIGVLKQRGTTVIIVSHRPATIGLADKLLVMNGGTAGLFGPRQEVIARLARNVPMRVVGRSGASYE